VIEEHARLSRAIATLLLLVAGGTGCVLDRAGLNGGDGAGGGAGPTDARVGDAPAGDGGHTGQGGAAGNGMGGSGGLGGSGMGGANGGNDGGGDVIAPQDAADAIAPPDAPVDVPSDLGGPDTGPADRPAIDAPPDAPACGSTALCDSSAVTVTLPGGRFTGTTAGNSSDHGTCGGSQAPEAVFKLVLTAKSDVFVTTHGTSFDTVIYMRSGNCCGTEVLCNDDADNRKTSVLTSRGLGAGTYFIFVDGANGGASGDFTVDIYATPTTINGTDNCGSPARIANLPVTGTTCGMNDDFAPNMGCLVGAQSTSGDGVYYFVLDANSTAVTFSTCTNTCIDTVLYTRDVCTTTSTQKSCNDNFCAQGAGSMCTGPLNPVQSRTAATLGPGVHYLIVDSHSGGPMTSCGSFTVTPSGVPQ
jgi:hypothetical protein